MAEYDGNVSLAPLLVAGSDPRLPASFPDENYVVRLWDFQVDRPGSGLQACAAGGVSCVLGFEGQRPLWLPLEIPEQWCGLLGASLALASFLQQERGAAGAQVLDISAVDILRSFADQNFANHKAFPESWSRNGRVTPNHGGIFPQGFFECADGHVAIVGRSKADWEMILNALDKPAWAIGLLLDPVYLAKNSQEVEGLFHAELAKFTRDQLLQLAIETGATFAPVYTPREMESRNLVPVDLFDQDGYASIPFEFLPF